MFKIILLVFLCLSASDAFAAQDWCPFERKEGNLCPYTWNAHLIILGEKYLSSSDWRGSNSTQGLYAAEIEIKHQTWPCYINFGLFSSRDEYFDKKANAATNEISLGLKKIWRWKDKLAPFLSGGLGYFYGKLGKTEQPSDGHYSGTGIGCWASTGIYYFFNHNIHFGGLTRYSQGDVKINGRKLNAGGTQIGFLIGYHF